MRQMLKADGSTRLPVDIASELCDALSRRQKELPSRWLAAVDAVALREGHDRVPRHRDEAVERELAIALLRDHVTQARPRGLVCLQPSASNAARDVVASICGASPVSAIIAAELDHTLATGLMDRIRPADVPATALVCDATVELPLPLSFPRPRFYLCLGNSLGRAGAVGAVRMLRVMRTTMMPGDGIILGLAARTAEHELDGDSFGDGPAMRHFAALGLVQAATGAALDPSRFDFQPTYDRETRRLETHLVARRTFTVELPGICDVRFRKGESIRTSVSDAFDRPLVSAMLAGVGLALRTWTTDDFAAYVVAFATPAV